MRVIFGLFDYNGRPATPQTQDPCTAYGIDPEGVVIPDDMWLPINQYIDGINISEVEDRLKYQHLISEWKANPPSSELLIGKVITWASASDYTNTYAIEITNSSGDQVVLYGYTETAYAKDQIKLPELLPLTVESYSDGKINGQWDFPPTLINQEPYSVSVIKFLLR